MGQHGASSGTRRCNAQSLTEQDTGTRAQRGASSVMALPGKDWAHSGHPTSSQSLPGLPEPCKYWWPGVGSGQATQVAGKEGRWTQSLAPAGLTRILCKNKTRELRTNPGYHRPPSAQDSSYCVPARRARPDPKTLWLGGVSAWASRPGCLSQRWLRETGTGDGDVPQGAGAMSSFDSSAAAGAPRSSGSVAPSRTEGTSTALQGGDVPSPTDTETLMFELKNKR